MFRWTVSVEGGVDTFGVVAAAVQNKVYVFSMECFGNWAELDTHEINGHVFNTVSLCWRKLTTVRIASFEENYEMVQTRGAHTAVQIEYVIYVWGGVPFCNVLYAFDVDTHSWFLPKVSGTVPEGRCYHSACVFGKIMYVHGGQTNRGNDVDDGTTNDTYMLDTSTMVWSLINTRGTTAPTSSHHSATIIGTKMFVLGGTGDESDGYSMDDRTFHRTFRVFDTETNCWLNTPSAQLPPGHAKSWNDTLPFTYNGELYMAGHTSRDPYLWKLNPENFSWTRVELKGSIPDMSGSIHWCWCMLGDRIVLFGAYSTSTHLYILDLSPSLKTLCKLAVIQQGLERSELPHDIRWELRAMTNV